MREETHVMLCFYNIVAHTNGTPAKIMHYITLICKSIKYNWGANTVVVAKSINIAVAYLYTSYSKIYPASQILPYQTNMTITTAEHSCEFNSPGLG